MVDENYSRKMDEIAVDIAEVKEWITASKSIRNKAFLRQKLKSLEMAEFELHKKQDDINNAPEAKQDEKGKESTAPTASPTSLASTQQEQQVKWSSVPFFYWDQTNTKVTVGVRELDGVGKLPSEQITCSFKKLSFDLRVMGLNGKNYRLQQARLQHEIVPGKSKMKVKANKIILYLWKEEAKWGAEHWTELKGTEKEQKMKENPGGMLMDTLKDLYAKGDDKTKEMIAKSMTQAREQSLQEGKMPAF